MAIASIRPAAVAGYFYPADERVLRVQIADMLSHTLAPEYPLAPRALIVPHAGYLYSGPVAAHAYAAIAALRQRIRRVVMLGPAHREHVEHFALPAAQAFATPLGEVPISRADWLALGRREDVVIDDHPHAQEHCLEVQLPFLQTMLDTFELVPLLVGNAPNDAVRDLLESLWGGDETLIVISSDLSHYHPYDEARTHDQHTLKNILALSPQLNHAQACGATPVNGFLAAARRRGLEPYLLDARNSGDTAGDRSRVVGYASIAFCDPPHAAACH